MKVKGFYVRVVVTGQYLVWRRVRVAQVRTGARLNRSVATARLGRGPRVGTIIRPPDDRNYK